MILKNIHTIYPYIYSYSHLPKKIPFPSLSPQK